MDFDYVTWSLRQADAVVPIGVNRLACTLLVVLPYRRVRLPRGLRHRRESSTSSSVRRAGHIFFYYSLCINYILCNNFFNYYYYYYLRFALFFVHRKMIQVGQYRQLGVLTYHVTSAGRGASSTPHYPTPGTLASLCRPALVVL